MQKNKISVSVILLFALLNLHWGTSSAQTQADPTISPNNAKMSEIHANFSDKPLAFHRCKKIEYPRFALRHEFEGTTELIAVTDSDARVNTVEVVKSSGWRLLDETVLVSIMGCKIFDKAWLEKIYVKGNFVWKLEGPSEVPAKLLTETCSNSKLVHLASSGEPGRGIVVGVWLNKEGEIDLTELQWQVENKLDQESLRLVRSCKFKPASNEKGNRASTISLRFLPSQTN